ncbi:MAG: DUF5069 domain-containing protein [Verrucomicrobiota bacterium]|nr:DUF5069 domain-containing protein [Verrucomicrobiota bacterium]
MLDKGRADIAGTIGEFKYDAPIDQHIINFLGLDVGALRKQLATGQGDGEILAWVMANAKHQRSAWEIEQWSEFMLRRAPGSDAETLAFVAERLAKFGAQMREDIQTWYDLIDLDDHITFHGKP